MSYLLTALLCIGSCLNVRTLDKEILLERAVKAFDSGLRSQGMQSFSETSLESFFLLKNENGKEDYIFVDLFGDNGFIVFNDSGNVCGYSTEGDASLLKFAANPYYNGFEFYDGELKIDLKDNQIGSENVFCDPTGSVAANFAYAIEYGGIDYYIQNKYSPSNYSLAASGKLPGYANTCVSEGYHQWTESVYTDCHYMSEGNCGIISTANAFAYYSAHGGYSNIP